MNEQLNNHVVHDVVATKQFLSFILAGEEYAIDILKVQEIREWSPATLVPNSPDYIEGVLNLRGEIIPIINLRTRFGIGSKDVVKNRIIIVLNVSNGHQNRLMGLLVDAFSETYDIALDKISSAPTNVSVVDDEFIIGLTTVENEMIILLDVDELLNSNELSLAEKDNVA